jgi:hypothetical protein
VESFDCEVVDKHMIDFAKVRCAAVSEVSESINPFLSVGGTSVFRGDRLFLQVRRTATI